MNITPKNFEFGNKEHMDVLMNSAGEKLFLALSIIYLVAACFFGDLSNNSGSHYSINDFGVWALSLSPVAFFLIALVIWGHFVFALKQACLMTATIIGLLLVLLWYLILIAAVICTAGAIIGAVKGFFGGD